MGYIICDYPDSVPSMLGLSKAVVHVWRVSLDRKVEERDWHILELSERQRAERFHQKVDRDRFAICRSVLRMILGGYLNRPPERIRFEFGTHGKPFLVGEDIHFNVSHSDGKSLIAVSNSGPVGIDLEPETRALNVEAVQRIVCSESERTRIFHLPAEARALALLQVWVGKEAFVKLTGEGLSRPLSQLDVTELPVIFIPAIPGFVSALAR
jgi:4'-phosphopantetheinyl transferase